MESGFWRSAPGVPARGDHDPAGASFNGSAAGAEASSAAALAQSIVIGFFISFIFISDY